MALGGIVEFLEHKTILVTGSTGFLAKVFVEKVVRIQPQVKKLFLLLRAADDATAAQRFQNEVLGKELFNVLREIHGKSFHSFISEKVHPIAGDISNENLGINNPTTLEMLCKETNIVINTAATTKFDERYEMALGTNTLGAKHVLDFAKKCVKLQLLLHVSTAYVAVEKEGVIKETPFQMGETLNGNLNLDIQTEVELARQRLDELQIQKASEVDQKITMKEMGLKRARLFGWPNTYVFTKAMGEMVLGHFREDLPLVIVRPTIVTSTIEEPFPGWIEGIRTIDSVMVGYGLGKLKRFMADPESIMDVVPVDMVVNAMINTIIAHSYEPFQLIYHLSSSLRNPINYFQLVNLAYHFFSKNPCIREDGNPIKVQRFPLLTSKDSFYRYMTLHGKIPLQGFRIVNGAFCQLFHGRYQRLKHKYRSALHMAQLYEPFVFFKGRFDDSNSSGLREAMERKIEEAKIFYFDPKYINWNDYFIKVHFPGVKKYLIK